MPPSGLSTTGVGLPGSMASMELPPVPRCCLSDSPWTTAEDGGIVFVSWVVTPGERICDWAGVAGVGPPGAPGGWVWAR